MLSSAGDWIHNADTETQREIECTKHSSGIGLVTVVVEQRLEGGDTQDQGKRNRKTNNPGEDKKPRTRKPRARRFHMEVCNRLARSN